jgi:hypothetical protein
VTATSSDISPGVLAPFVGEWKILAAFESMTPSDIGGRVSFEWLPGKRFLIERCEIPVPEAPDGIAIIGAEQYFDSRGIARV